MHFGPRLSAAAALLASAASAQTTFTYLGAVDLSSTSTATNAEYIGSNPSAVAWNGSRLFVAGFNNGGLAGVCSIVEVIDPLGTPSYGPVFGVEAPPSLRGYSGLDIKGNLLASSYDSGAVDPHGIGAWDVSAAGSSTAPSNAWYHSGRGGSGVGFDPGYMGVDLGVGWTTFGSGRRSLNDQATGAVIYDSTNGTIINGSGTGTFWRDMDYDDATGDIWLREGNNLIRAPRTGGNTTATAILVVDELEADFVAGQNVAYISTIYGDRVIYNERNNGSTTQDLVTQMRVVSTDGTPQTVTWSGFASPAPSTAYYDFSWDEATQSLALLDFGNRAVFFFRLEPPAPANYCSAGTSTNGCNATMGYTGAPPSASTASGFTIVVSNVEGQKQGIIFYGVNGPNAVPWGAGGSSFLCVKSPTQRTGGQNAGGSTATCTGQLSLDWDAWTAANPSAVGAPYAYGAEFHAQGWYRDPPAVKTTSLSDGLRFFIQL